VVGVEQAANDAWRPHFASANYLFEAGEVDRALGFVDKSIAIQATWRNEWLRAQIEAKKGNTSEAKVSAARAQQLGKDDSVYEQNFKATIAKTTATWK